MQSNYFLKTIQISATSALMSLAVSSSAMAAVSLSEMLIDAQNLGTAGTADQDQEFIEIASDTGGIESLAGLYFIAIEGDAPGTDEGVVDVAIDLSSFSTGSNGLLVLTDGNLSWNPQEEAASSIQAVEFNNDDGSGDDIENGSMTFAIVSGYTGTPGQDLDTNDDGVLDATPWTSVIDAVGWKEAGTGTELTYAVQMGGVEFDSNDITDSIDAYVVGPDGNGYVLGVLDRDADGLANGPYEIITAALSEAAPTSILIGADLNNAFTLTPGSENLPVLDTGETKAVPAMGTFGIATLFAGLIALAAKLRKQS